MGNHLSHSHLSQGYTQHLTNSLPGRCVEVYAVNTYHPITAVSAAWLCPQMKPRRHRTITLHLIPELTDLMFRRLCQDHSVLAASLRRWLWVMPADMSCCHRDDSLSITIRNITASLPKRQSAEEWPSSHHHHGCSSRAIFSSLDFYCAGLLSCPFLFGLFLCRILLLDLYFSFSPSGHVGFATTVTWGNVGTDLIPCSSWSATDHAHAQ